MAFSAAEIQNAANAVLALYQKGPFLSQSIQDKPLLKALDDKKKTFAGGNQFISIPVKGKYTTTIQGFSYNDQVSYANPANGLRAVYPWKEIHAGITITETELKINGQSVTDENGKDVSDHGGRDAFVLADLLEDKLEDMTEGYARGKNNMFWLDGTQDSKLVPGLTSLIVDASSQGTTGGIDRSVNPWWRNLSYVGSGAGATGAKIVSSDSLQTLTKFLTSFNRQLKRYAKKKDASNWTVLAGSGFIDACMSELRAKGNTSMTGFANASGNDISTGDISFKGLGTFQYDPTLDDLGFGKRAYFIDLNAIKEQPMEGEENKMRNPSRPFDRYVLYRAMTWAGALTANQLNTSGVIEVA